MISAGYIHEQMAAAHNRDLLETTEHARRVGPALRTTRRHPEGGR
jgi:hypothetical protein